MKGIRDWDWTQDGLFYDDSEPFDYFMGTILGGVAAMMPALGIGALFSALSPAFGTIIGLIFFLAATSHMFWVPRLNRWHNIESWQMQLVGRKYRSLSERDRKEFFPANFEKMLKRSNDMTYHQQRDIQNQFYGIVKQIEVRDAAIKHAEAKFVDTDGLLDDLSRGRQYAQIEAETMREHL